MATPTVALVLLVKNELEPMKEMIPKIDLSVVDDIAEPSRGRGFSFNLLISTTVYPACSKE